MNSKDFEIENVSCLAGRNIEGKTNILKALTKLNPADPLDGIFFDLRMPGEQLGDLNDRPENVLQTRWILLQEDIRAIEKYLGRDCLTSEVVTVRKGYKNELQWDLPINFDRYRTDWRNWWCPITRSIAAGRRRPAERFSRCGCPALSIRPFMILSPPMPSC